jgi:hypothetical protein
MTFGVNSYYLSYDDENAPRRLQQFVERNPDSDLVIDAKAYLLLIETVVSPER